MPSAADLRERVAFEQQAAGDDTYGGTQGAWEEQFTCRARIWYRTGTEPVIAQRLTGIQPVEITVRSSHLTRAVDASWRIRDANAGTLLNIRSVAPDEHRGYIKMMCDVGGAV